jgi:hypothetical protein
MNLWARCAKRYSGPAKTSQNVRFRFERPRGTVKNSLIVSIDPGGRILVAAGIVDMSVRDGDNVRHVPAALTVFRIGADGKLTIARKYDVELGGKFQWWTGFVELPA